MESAIRSKFSHRLTLSTGNGLGASRKVFQQVVLGGGRAVEDGQPVNILFSTTIP